MPDSFETIFIYEGAVCFKY